MRHKVRIGARATGTRFELELKGERAEFAAPLVFEDAEQPPKVVVGLIQDFVDFVDVESDSNRSRCAYLPFWGAFITDCERLTVFLTPRKDMSLERMVGWLERQVSAALATFEEAGHDVMKLVRYGRGRMGDRHRALIAAAGVA